MKKKIIFLIYSILFVFATYGNTSCSDPIDDTLIEKMKEETARIEENLLKNTLKMNLQKYLIIDALRVTNAYKDIPKTVDDIYKINKDSRDFSEFFLNIKEDANALILMKNHLEVILGFIKENKLPEYIILNDSKIEKYEKKGNIFKISILVNVSADSFLIKTREWNKKENNIKIEATGEVNNLPSNQINPLGIKINSFKVTYLKKEEKKYEKNI